MPLSSVDAVARVLGYAATPTDAAELAVVTNILDAARTTIHNESGSQWVDAEAENIPGAAHIATEMVAKDYWQARRATRGGGLAAGVDADVPSPLVINEVRRMLAPFRRLTMFGGASSSGTGGTSVVPGTGGGSFIIADGSITLQQLAPVVQRLIEEPTIANDSITILQLTPLLREQIQASGIAAGSITTTELAPALVTLIENPTPNANSISLAQLQPAVRTQVTNPTLPNDSIALTKLTPELQMKINAPVPANESITLEQLTQGLQTTIGSPTPAAGTITLAMLNSNLNTLVTSPTPPNDSVSTEKIQDGAVTTIKIGNDQVTSDKIAAGNVDTTELADGAVTTTKIGNDQVTAAKIAAGNVDTTELADGAVTAVKIDNDAVTTDKLIDDAVTLEKMADNSVTAHQIVDGSLIPATYGNQTIPNIALENGVITESKFHADVTTKLNNPVIGEGTIDTTQIALGAVSRTRIDPNFLADLPPGGQGVSPVNRRIFLGSPDLRIPTSGNVTYGQLAGFRRVDGNQASQDDGALLTGERTYVIRWLQSGTQYVNNGNHLPHGTILDNRGVINLANGSWYVDVNLVIIPDPGSPAGNDDRMMAAAILFYGAQELHSSSHYFPNYHFNTTDYRSTQSRINVSGFVHDDGSSRMSVGFRVIIQGGSNLAGYRVPRANFHAVRIM